VREILHHVGLVSADIERAIPFYSGLLGLELLARGRESDPRYAEMFGVAEIAFRWAEFDLGGGHLLELIEYEPAPERPAAGPPAGLPAGPHFALRVPDADAVYEALTRHGAKVFSRPVELDEDNHWLGARVFYALDPDLNLIEIVEEAGAAGDTEATAEVRRPPVE
jgi:catechol 2,3-dioxygenase-like lactoylglutathione lyase family enzyme